MEHHCRTFSVLVLSRIFFLCVCVKIFLDPWNTFFLLFSFLKSWIHPLFDLQVSFLLPSPQTLSTTSRRSLATAGPAWPAARLGSRRARWSDTSRPSTSGSRVWAASSAPWHSPRRTTGRSTSRPSTAWTWHWPRSEPWRTRSESAVLTEAVVVALSWDLFYVHITSNSYFCIQNKIQMIIMTLKIIQNFTTDC